MTLIASSSLHADWSEPVRISFNLGLIIPRVTAVGDTLHVVGRTNQHFYYLRSNDNGLTWSDPIAPASGLLYSSEYPEIVAAADLLHLTFIGFPNDYPWQQAYHMSSSDGGRSWSQPHQVFIDYGPAFFKYPRLAAKGDTLFLSVVRYPKRVTHSLLWESIEQDEK
jgi:hypothetical protein